MELGAFFELMGVAEKLKRTYRHSWTSGGRRESVAEHSWRLGFMAWLLQDELEGVDSERLMRMCLLHDLGEALTGDVPSFVKNGGDEAAEERAVGKILDLLPPARRDELQAIFAEMKALQTPEAKAWRALDTLEAVLQHNEAPLATWLEVEHSLQLDYGVAEAECQPVIKAIRARARQDSMDKLSEAGYPAPENG